MNTELDTVIFDVISQDGFFERIKAAARAGQPAQTARISFSTPEQMFKMLSDNRWSLLKALCGAGQIGVRELARRVGRDVRAVHNDVSALVKMGVIDRSDKGKLLFPYRHIKVQFELDALAA